MSIGTALLVFVVLPAVGGVVGLVALLWLLWRPNPHITLLLGSLSVGSVSYGAILVVEPSPSVTIIALLLIAGACGLVACVLSVFMIACATPEQPSAWRCVSWPCCLGAVTTLVGAVIGYSIGCNSPERFFPHVPADELHSYFDSAQRVGLTTGQAYGTLVGLIFASCWVYAWGLLQLIKRL